eukprot:COSAG01_NODE_13779_length_1537_cov_0.917246_1_plen_137_part_00
MAHSTEHIRRTLEYGCGTPEEEISPASRTDATATGDGNRCLGAQYYIELASERPARQDKGGTPPSSSRGHAMRIRSDSESIMSSDMSGFGSEYEQGSLASSSGDDHNSSESESGESWDYQHSPSEEDDSGSGADDY